jgi:hypothetical protein
LELQLAGDVAATENPVTANQSSTVYKSNFNPMLATLYQDSNNQLLWHKIIALSEPKNNNIIVQGKLWGLGNDKPYYLSEENSRHILSMNTDGKQVRGTDTGNSIVCCYQGVFYKQSPDGALMECMVHQLHSLIDREISTPTVLLLLCFKGNIYSIQASLGVSAKDCTVCDFELITRVPPTLRFFLLQLGEECLAAALPQLVKQDYVTIYTEKNTKLFTQALRPAVTSATIPFSLQFHCFQNYLQTHEQKFWPQDYHVSVNWNEGRWQREAQELEDVCSRGFNLLKLVALLDYYPHFATGYKISRAYLGTKNIGNSKIIISNRGS